MRQLIPDVFSPVMNVGKPYNSTLKPEKEKINISYVNLINGLYILGLNPGALEQEIKEAYKDSDGSAVRDSKGTGRRYLVG